MAQAQNVQQVRDLVSSEIGQSRMLLVVDDIWQAEPAKIFGSLGSHCAHLFISRLPEVAVSISSGKPTKIQELSNQEGVELLRQFIPEVVAAEPDAALELVDVCGGLPLALTLLGNWLKLASFSGDSERIRDALNALRDEKKRLEAYRNAPEVDNSPLALTAAIELSFSGALLTDAERNALLVLSIFRPKPHAFSKDMANKVAGVANDVLYKLNDKGLIECVQSNHYTMQRTIAEYIREKLPKEELASRYHGAVEYFREKMVDIEKDLKSEGNYAGWYRYESEAWQDAKNDWLYYLSLADDERASILAFLRAYFDAFWWWGCFLDFDYCNQLIKEWHKRVSSERANEVLSCVHGFQEAYPKETESRDAKSWLEVEAALVRLMQLAKLDENPLLWLSEENRHVRGLIDIFRAEVCRFGRKDLDQAAKWYGEACDLFGKNADNWNLAWALFHFSEMNVECGNDDVALDQLSRSLDLGASEKDPEVVALAHRVRGDIFLARKDFSGAKKSYQNAAFHAYRFQVDPESPDAYTVQFYEQLVGRILVKVRWLSGEFKSAAISLCVSMYDFWRPAWTLLEMPLIVPDFEKILDEGNLGKLRACMFPPGLSQEDISDQGAKYTSQVKSVCASLTDKISS